MDQKAKSPLAGAETRRDFIRKSATAAAVVASANIFKTPVYGQNRAPSAGRVIGANDRIVVGYIGVGGQGMAHVNSQKEAASDDNIAQAAVCDVSKTRIDKAKETILKDNPNAKVEGYEDHRKLLERNDIDAVCISTVDHWHTRCSVDAMTAGKHVYVEKPMTRYLGEAFEIYDTVKRTGKKLQVGSQGCSDAKWHKAAEVIKSGKLGPLVMLEGSYMRNAPKGEWNYDIQSWASPSDIDWTHWLGPVHKKPSFSADHYFRWRTCYPYCSGLLGDLFPHRLHPYMLATGNPEFPRRVLCLGTRKIMTDKNTPGTPMRDVPEIVEMLAEFPSGLTMIIASSTVSEYGMQEVIRGHHARLEMGGGGKIELKPERPFTEEVDPQEYPNLQPGEHIKHHEKNWFDCIRSGKEPNANIELAVRVQTVISLAEMSDRLQEACIFDDKTRSVKTGGGKKLELPTYGWTELS